MGQVFKIGITTEDKQCALDDAYDRISPNNTDLRTELRAGEATARAIVGNGQILKNSSSNGHSAEMFAGGDSSATPQEFAKMFRELINLFDSAKQWLIAPPCSNVTPIPVPTDLQVYDKMKEWLFPVTESHNDYGPIRIGVNWI